MVREHLSYLLQSVLQGRFQGVGWVNDKDSAGWQPWANDIACVVGDEFAGFNGQCGVQPGLACFVAQGFELARQLVGLGAWDDGVPHGINSGGKAGERIRHHVGYTVIIALDFIAWIAKYKRPASRWRQKFPDAFKAILTQYSHLTPHIKLINMGCECFDVGGVKLEQFEFVSVAQQMLN